MDKRDRGASLTEATLVILLICFFSIASLSSIKDRAEATLWLVTLSLMSPETRLPDGRTMIDVWAPASAFRIYGGIAIPNNWCRVILYRFPDETILRPRVQSSDIRECADQPS